MIFRSNYDRNGMPLRQQNQQRLNSMQLLAFLTHAHVECPNFPNRGD